MTTPKWHEGRMAALDFESTDKDPLTARIVTAALVYANPGHAPRTMSWVIDPGIPVPDEAAEIHGWTTERIARETGPYEAYREINGGDKQPLTRDGALNEIASQVATVMHTGAPLIIFNAAYDLTLLEAELDRNGIDTLASRPDGIRGVVDPMVVEKEYDKFRKVCYRAPGCRQDDGHHECGGCRGGGRDKFQCGGCGIENRKLPSLCKHYGVVHGGAHDAAEDCLAAGRLLFKLVDLWPQIGTWRLPTLHEHQVTWSREHSDSLRDFWRKKDDERWLEVDSGWPLHSSLTQMAVAS